MTEMHRLVYSSRSKLAGSRAEIEARIRRVLAVSRVKNQASGITGALVFDARNFVQVLEGSIEPIRRLFTVIRNDPRHSDVRVLAMEIAPKRVFPIWSMGFYETAESGHPLAHVCFEAGFGGASGEAGAKLLNRLRSELIQMGPSAIA